MSNYGKFAARHAARLSLAFKRVVIPTVVDTDVVDDDNDDDDATLLLLLSLLLLVVALAALGGIDRGPLPARDDNDDVTPFAADDTGDDT